MQDFGTDNIYGPGIFICYTNLEIYCHSDSIITVGSLIMNMIHTLKWV
jgi:hypothetical protein